MEEDYKKKVIELVYNINNQAFFEMVYNFMVALKKKWGI